ncbi:CHAT domain-containing protein [Armatimonas rosea]|nr:CHAT domain-containing protein [Armatimonas rosea]
MNKKNPMYVVLFDDFKNKRDVYMPYISREEVRESISSITVPHGLSKELVSCIKSIWYCLHLPASFFDLIDLQARHIISFKEANIAHQIILMPLTLIAEANKIIKFYDSEFVPVTIFCPDYLVDSAKKLAEEIGNGVFVIQNSELNPGKITDIWKEIHKNMNYESDFLDMNFGFINRLDIAPILLTNNILRRRLKQDMLVEPNGIEEIKNLKNIVIDNHIAVAAIARCEDAEMSVVEAEEAIGEFIEHESRSLKLPLSIVAPGVPSLYIDSIYEDGTVLTRSNLFLDPLLTWNDVEKFDDSKIENAIINFIATHRAIARNGTVISTMDIPNTLFKKLNNIEKQYLDSSLTKRRHVWRWINDMGNSAASLFDEESVDTLKRASFVNIFSNFPLGLAILPGDTSPYCCRVPIAYRPILPLTRALQVELLNPPYIEWSETISILIVECISESDRIGKLSRSIWKHIAKEYANNANIKIIYVEAESSSDVASLLSEYDPNVLIISAHGHYAQESNSAGIMIGKDFCMGDDLGDMPPLVILSACNVAPRGIGAVNIADLLMRQGALAVIGTLVPVDIRHNAILINRLFVYINETMSGKNSMKNFAEIWHHVTTSNAVNDILFSSTGISQWASMKHEGKSILELFTQERSVGRLRNAHIYNDTITVLKEIAVENKTLDKVNAWLSRPGYAPETLFYIMIGWPEKITMNFIN